MAVTESLLNYRESAVPELRNTDEIPGFSGDYPQTYVRQYRAVIQVQNEGDTQEVLDRAKLYGSLTGVVVAQDLPPFLNFITVETGIIMTYGDLNPTIPDSCVSMITEIIVNHSLSEFGKANLTISIDLLCPPEWYDAPAAVWRPIEEEELPEPIEEPTP